MSGQTVAAEIRAQSTKLDAGNARFESKLDALQNEIRSQRSMIWTLIAILGTAVVGGLGAPHRPGPQVALPDVGRNAPESPYFASERVSGPRSRLSPSARVSRAPRRSEAPLRAVLPGGGPVRQPGAGGRPPESTLDIEAG